MIKRTLLFENPTYLSFKNHQLVAEYPDGSQKTAAIEDIGVIILEHQQITITHYLLAYLAEQKVVVITCATNHLPVGLLQPLSANSEHNRNVRYQLEASIPLQKNLWKQVVTAKILNQAQVLRFCGLSNTYLIDLASKVKSGDSENLEAKAAAFYWQQLFGHKFNRRTKTIAPNPSLNYGYAILRAIVARSLLGSGMLPLMGIHHANKYNPYCLADDIMEPFRPFVDLLVLDLVEEYSDDELTTLTRDHKLHLVTLPHFSVQLGSKQMPLLNAIQHCTANLMRCLKNEERKLNFPVHAQA